MPCRLVLHGWLCAALQENRSLKRPFPFSINEILGTPPAKKLRQGFLINQLLGLVQQGEGSETSPSQKLPTNFVEKLGSSIEHNAKFHFTKVKSRFIIKDLPADAEVLLSCILEHCIDEAKMNSREKRCEPTHLGCLISGPLLDGGDVFVPIRPITTNTTDSIMNLFTKIVQSKKQKGTTLLGEPFTVTVTTVDRNSLPSKRHLKGSARRRLAPVHHQVYEKCLIKIHNPDERNFCLFYALQATMVVKTRGWPSRKFYDYIHSLASQLGKFHHDTEELMRQIRAPLNLDAYDADTYVPLVIDHWNNAQRQQQHRFAVFIFGESGHYKPLYKYGHDDYDTLLALYFSNKHFDGVHFLSGLFAGKRYCISCERPYSKATMHSQSCKAHCLMCSRVGPAFPCPTEADFIRQCKACHKNFRNAECYNHHLQSNYCTRSKKCQDCGIIWDVHSNTRKGRKGHVCGEKFCNLCNNFHNIERGCFIQQIETGNQIKPYRFIAFDLETMQHLPTDPLHPERRNHEPNYICAKVACPECSNNGSWQRGTASCPVCGPHRTVAFCQRPFNGTAVDNKVVTDKPMEAFVDWLVFQLPLKYDTYAYSHYGGRFDMVITFRELFRRGFNPEMLRKGNKMYEMKIMAQKKKNPNIIFRDSFNLMPCSIGQLVPAYGLDVEEKPFFPHMANRTDNYGRQIFPTPEDYLAQGMMPEKRRQFDLWYEQHRGEPFLLDEALASYCTNDVDILMSALIAFRREFLEVTKRHENIDDDDDRKNHDGIDVLKECMTIASACMKHFRTNHLAADHLAIVPERGYDNAQNQSLLALRFFKWYAEKHGVQLQTAHSAGGEKRVTEHLRPYICAPNICAPTFAPRTFAPLHLRPYICAPNICAPTFAPQTFAPLHLRGKHLRPDCE